MHTTRCAKIPKRHIMKITREYAHNQAIGIVTQHVVADPILMNFTSVALSHLFNNKKHIINQKFDKVLCHKRMFNSAKKLPLAVACSVVDANNDFIMSSMDDAMDHVNFTTHHEITHEIINGVFFVLKFLSILV